jgi:hypothetical protein
MKSPKYLTSPLFFVCASAPPARYNNWHGNGLQVGMATYNHHTKTTITTFWIMLKATNKSETWGWNPSRLSCSIRTWRSFLWSTDVCWSGYVLNMRPQSVLDRAANTIHLQDAASANPDLTTTKKIQFFLTNENIIKWVEVLICSSKNQIFVHCRNRAKQLRRK